MPKATPGGPPGTLVVEVASRLRSPSTVATETLVVIFSSAAISAGAVENALVGSIGRRSDQSPPDLVHQQIRRGILDHPVAQLAGHAFRKRLASEQQKRHENQRSRHVAARFAMHVPGFACASGGMVFAVGCRKGAPGGVHAQALEELQLEHRLDRVVPRQLGAPDL
jgi:hypothetical protein